MEDLSYLDGYLEMDTSDELELLSQHPYMTTRGSAHVIEDEFNNIEEFDFDVGYEQLFTKKTRNTPKRKNHWDSNWGRMLQDPDLLNSWTKSAKKFRRRFRITYPLFLYLVELCKEVNLFEIKRIKGSVPTEIRILIGLRMLGRGNCGDDIEELSIEEFQCQLFIQYFISS